jgi:cell division initiation protein
MLTPQEVSGHAFPKAVVGGYNMSAVDEFLDELTDDYTALYKENAALKAKMKVLVEKVEDYRATEDSMRATLLTAQKMADSIVKEAEQKRDQMLTQAETDARVRVAQLDQETAAAQERLRAGQTELAKFIAASRAVCDREQQFLEQLPEHAGK